MSTFEPSALRAALGQDRNRGYAACAAAGGRRHARSIAPEPGLDGEVRHAHVGRGTKGDVVIDTVEVERAAGRSIGRCRRLIRRARAIGRGIDRGDDVEVGRAVDGGRVDVVGRCHGLASAER